ncbi:MAG: DUF58 domain-containing protein [Lachnospira sp.]|nr:DUF58 domain-containing protein [Lachnospira sp.]
MVKRRVVYVLAWIILFAVYMFTTGYSIFVVLVIMALLPVISAFYALFIRDNLYIEIDNSHKMIIRGEKMGYDVIVRNKSHFVASDINLVVGCVYNNYDVLETSSHIINVDGGEKECIRVNQRMKYIGVLTVKTDDSYIMDPLRLFRFTLKDKARCQVTVMPVLNEPDYYALYNPLDENVDSNEYSKKRKGEDASQIFDVRNFADGDSLNRVHWKLSAKEDELLVKEFSHPITKDNCILLEIHKFETEQLRYNLNGVFEMVYAIGNLACVKEKEFSIAFYSSLADELRVIDVLSHEELTEAVLLIIQEESYEGNKALEYYLASEIKDSCKLYYVTDNCDEEVFELEDKTKTQAYIYDIGSGEDCGKVTHLVRNVILEVDRDDIRWGLANTQF